ncbi:MAG: hypothetical protein LBD50_02015 [Rickettsiales bacterium]|jgi:hypothetical protein|nr:hypothetical protein [Rickettsiales bacterium]
MNKLETSLESILVVFLSVFIVDGSYLLMTDNVPGPISNHLSLAGFIGLAGVLDFIYIRHLLKKFELIGSQKASKQSAEDINAKRSESKPADKSRIFRTMFTGRGGR